MTLRTSVSAVTLSFGQGDFDQAHGLQRAEVARERGLIKARLPRHVAS